MKEPNQNINEAVELWKEGCDNCYPKPVLMYAIVSHDIAGSTVQLFKTKEKADEFMQRLNDPF